MKREERIGPDESHLFLWVPCKEIFACPECQRSSLEQVEEESILDTFRCAQGHIWYRMRPEPPPKPPEWYFKPLEEPLEEKGPARPPIARRVLRGGLPRLVY